SSSTTYSSEDEERRRHFFNSLTAGKSLQDDLLEQLQMSEIPDELRPVAQDIIGNIDEKGYFRGDLEELPSLQGIASQRERKRVAEEALKWVQRFEPPGVAARDLRECLLIQLELAGKKDTLAWKLVDKYLDALAQNAIPKIAKKLGTPIREIYEALEEIRSLQPRPGSAYDSGASTASEYVVPEVFVEKANGRYVVRTNRDVFPKLSIASRFLALLENPDVPSEVKTYVRQKLASSEYLINVLKQREDTLKRVAEFIVEKQQEFFEFGEEALKPLTMKEAAEALGIHQTTVSRAVANKYMMTPRGLVPFRLFFSSGYTSDSGEALSQKGIKQKIQHIIANEDPTRPLPDQKISDLLQKEGYKVSRRTVSKYREEMGIPPARLRRKHR
ncbi:MAG: RNA polymerase sigma-54 factor, partial [Lentisphaerae bacterium]